MSAIVSVKTALDTANPTNLPDALKKVLLGTLVAGRNSVVVAQASAATVPLSPPALTGTVMARVTAGAAAAGPRTITDAAGTPAATVATISDDGATLTFEAGVTGAVISYVPRPTDAQLAANLYPES
jgi:hypothetical protein